MSVGKRYVLDANVFIEAHQRHYAFDICPAFWDALHQQHELERVFSIDKVKAELIKVKGNVEDQDGALEDKLSKWVQERVPNTFFMPTTDEQVSFPFRDMVTWVQNEPQFTPQAKAEFSSVADGWLVAYAKANGLVVVTHEGYAPEAKKTVKIPNVCIEFDVDYCNTYDMLRELKQRFVLKKRERRN